MLAVVWTNSEGSICQGGMSTELLLAHHIFGDGYTRHWNGRLCRIEERKSFPNRNTSDCYQLNSSIKTVFMRHCSIVNCAFINFRQA